MSIDKKLLSLKNYFFYLIENILKIKEMIPGTYKEVYRKCGKSYCWCANEKKGHPLKRITWSDKGKSKSKAIQNDDVDWVNKMTAQYKQLKLNRQELRTCERKIGVLLDQYEEEIIQKTRKRKNYL